MNDFPPTNGPFDDFINDQLEFDGPPYSIPDDLRKLLSRFISQDGEPHDPFDCDAVHPILAELLDSLGQPLESGIWGDRLTPLELQLRACLAEDILHGLIRNSFNNFPKVSEMSDDDIRKLLTYPLTLAMIAVKFFRERGWYDDPNKPGR